MRWDISTKAVEVAKEITVVVDEVVDVAVATEVAVDAGEAVTPTPTPTKGRQEINSPFKVQDRCSTFKFLLTVTLKDHLKEGSSTSTRVPTLEDPCRAVCLSRWPIEPKAALTAASTAP